MGAKADPYWKEINTEAEAAGVKIGIRAAWRILGSYALYDVKTSRRCRVKQLVVTLIQAICGGRDRSSGSSQDF